MSEKYSYSHNEENYYGSFDTRAEAIEEGIDGFERCWTGRNVPPRPLGEYFDIEDVLEKACGDAEEYGGEWAERWYRATPEMAREINAEVASAIAAWLTRHGLEAKFFNVTDVQKHTAEADA